MEHNNTKKPQPETSFIIQCDEVQKLPESPRLHRIYQAVTDTWQI